MPNSTVPEHTSSPAPAGPDKSSLLLGWLLNFWRNLENIAFVLVLLLIGLYFVLQSNWVQNWLINRITNYLSTELQATVQIGHLDIAFFDNLALEQVYISDLRGDTLLYAGQLTAGLKNNIFSLFNDRLEFDEITLHQARVNLRRYAGEYDFNYQFLADYFGGSSSKPKRKKPPFSIKIRTLRLDDVVLLQHSEVSGQKMTIHLPSLLAKVNNFDPNSKIADIESVELSGFFFDFEDYPSQKMPPRPTALPDTSSQQLPAVPFRFFLRHFQLEAGRFDLDRYFITPQKTTPPGVMDYNHLSVHNIAIKADSIEFTSDYRFEGMVQHLSAEEQSGFAIRHAKADKLTANDTCTALYGTLIQTDRSSLGDTIVFNYSEYRDFYRFNNQVKFDIRLQPESYLTLGDLRPLQKSLYQNSFFEKNDALKVGLAGTVRGKVNQLDARGLQAKIGAATLLEFDMDGEDLAKGTDVMRLEMRFKKLQSNLNELEQIIPGLALPSRFDRLGNFNFVGNYNLLFGYNHILDGKLQSDIGAGSLDMKLDLSRGTDNAYYSGRLNLHHLKLNTITNNADFGDASFNLEIEEGSHGLKASNMHARVKGTLDSLEFRDYSYHAVVLDGIFSPSLFEGKASIDDPNLQFAFDGTLNLQGEVPIYKFSTDLKKADLKNLNLSQKDLVLSANVDNVRLTGKTIADLAGKAAVYDIRIRQQLDDKTIYHHIDSIRFESSFLSDDYRHFAIQSEILTAEVDGRYNLGTAVNNLLRLLSRHFPVFAAQLKLPKADSSLLNDQYRFGIHITNTQDLTRLLDRQLDTIANVSIGGQVNAEAGFTELYAQIPRIKYGSTSINQLALNWRSELNTAAFILNAPSTSLTKKNKLPPIMIKGNINKDSLHFKMDSKDPNALLINSVLLKGAITVVDSLWQVHFDTSNFEFLEHDWVIEKDNYIRFGNQYIEAHNVELYCYNRRIFFETFNRGRGLKLLFSNFDLDFFNQFIPLKGIQLDGMLSDFDLSIQDVFSLQKAELNIGINELIINKTSYGELFGSWSLESLNHPLEWKVTNLKLKEEASLITSGAWMLPSDSVGYSALTNQSLRSGELYSDVRAEKYPMQVLQLFIPGISKTSGRLKLNAVFDNRIPKRAPKMNLDGRLEIQEGSFVIDYLNTPFHIKNQHLRITHDSIWASGKPYATVGIQLDTIYDDSQKSMALVKGGLKHDFFSKWKIECEVQSVGDNFKLLDTQKPNNPDYYGTGYGSFKAVFGGTFSRTEIKVDAVARSGSRLFIPLTETSEAPEITFINFKPKVALPETSPKNATPRKKLNPAESSGLNIEMNITLTDQAEVQLIFDEKAGDILKGKGVGDITILATRDGDFKMYGSYTIRSGEYLFTLLNIANKPFTVLNGGTISWFGDPYGAQINITATYSETAPLYDLIRDELAIVGSNPALIAEANKSTRVSVNMLLTGDLFKPSIAFSLAFPNVTAQLKNFADNKLRLLAQDPNEINRQVFGLILFGSFLPPDQFTPKSAGEYVSTLTQFVSSQLSRYLTGIVSEYFGGSVSSLDLDITYKDNAVDFTSANAITSGRDLQLRMRGGFAEDRITIQIGSQFGIARPGVNVQDGFIGEDIVIEIQPIKDKQWRFKVYQRSEPDLAGGGFRNRFGIGLSFSREFDSFGDLRSGISKWIASVKKEKHPPYQ